MARATHNHARQSTLTNYMKQQQQHCPDPIHTSQPPPPPHQPGKMAFPNLTSRDPPSVPDSPAAKRQKTVGGYQGNGYNSADDSGDDLFEGIVPDTKHFTQPTQIIDTSAPGFTLGGGGGREEVLVPASSPFAGNARSSPPQQTPGRIASLMAPAGTAFKAPNGVQKEAVKTKVIDLDENDGPTYQGGSSDDEIRESAADIKPSIFKARSKITFGSPSGSGAAPSFRDLISTFKPPVSTTAMFEREAAANGVKRKTPMQSGPARALPTGVDYTMEDIPDLVLRRKVERVRKVAPQAKISQIVDCVIKCQGRVDDATVMVFDILDIVEITSDDDSKKGVAVAKPKEQPMEAPEPQMRRQLKQPIASIQERYSSTQYQKKVPLVPTSPVAVTPPKPKRKLMQGRRNPDPSSPMAAPSPLPKKQVPEKIQEVEEIILSDAEDYDSDAASEEEDNPELEGRVLSFLNKCSKGDLIDLANIKPDVAEFFLSKRPFGTLDSAREVSNAKETKTGKQSARAPIGDRIVDTSMSMMSGYEAVDALVATCSELGKPLTEEMTRWGFDVNGAAKGGELEMVSLEEDLHDSGLGTPSSKSTSEVGDDDVRAVSKKGKNKFLKKPEKMASTLVLKDYQLVGLNWLALLYKYKLSCILADDMGLGKTCQVIAFLSHLAETGETGPHLVIVPPSTLENWLREFANFAPELVVEPYYGSQKERQDIAERILDARDEVNVVVSTYEFAAKKDDNKFMRRLKPNACVYDEGHVLKNPKSLKYQGLIKIPAQFRLLLTGTPLQNNLMELAALLGFILPDIFRERQEDLEFIFKHKASTRDSDHAALLSAQRIARAKSMLTPFVLRRKKAQVLKHMPAKICKVEYCEMHPTQAEIYNGLRGRARERAQLRLSGGKVPNDGENNPLMQLRKAAIHPMLFRRHFTDAKLEKMVDLLRRQEPDEFSQPRDKILMEMKLLQDYYLHTWCLRYPCIKKFDTPDLTWMNSGKVDALVRLVKQYKENGDRVLVFSQFTLVLDIIEAVFQTELIQHTRFDGATKVNERQTLIDDFRDDETITAFLLSTGAGGTGVNLMYANKVIIFDSSFNPQDDIQAENRAHRVGQTREVEVVRLVTKGTIEEQIYALGQSKLELDSKVSGEEDLGVKGEQMVARMLLQEDGEGTPASNDA
ncbi:hypothetical protein V496_07030 [Pseudogymnoascus sp. VKM F-4515 (FW-2607)]|nr:hypothetical protein V496_07030 [Pseudogymnoascus sp. VKM F-4515 (FW-2607)]KFY82988.1 hypothetical protein V498_08354 [Pseudogymnoascus sp. VKM F-4517 (FW-2822)]